MDKNFPYSMVPPGDENNYKDIQVDNHQHIPTSKKTVIMVDARVIVRESLLEVLRQRSNDLFFLSYSTVDEAIEQVNTIQPKGSVFLLNIGSAWLSESMLESCVKSLHNIFPKTPIIVLADNEEALSINLFLQLELSGFMTTNISYGVLTAALKLVLAGGKYIPECLVLMPQCSLQDKHEQFLPFKNTQSIDDKSFTPRQLEVLKMLYHGSSNKLIAYQLGICESTVKVHVRKVMRKLQVTNRTQVSYLVSRIFGE